MHIYYIHKILNQALKISYNQYSEIKFESDGTYSVTTTNGEYPRSKLKYYIGISREDLIKTINTRTVSRIKANNINLKEQILENERKLLRLERMEYDNI
jgi:hypothetical protein